MAARPTIVPRWAWSAPVGGLVQPPTGQAASGFSTGQRPPAQWFNWLLHQLGAWTDFLRGAHTGQWTRRYWRVGPTAASFLPRAAVDEVSQDGASVRWRWAMVNIVSGVSPAVQCSRRGVEWVERDNFPPGTADLTALEFFRTTTHPGGKWWATAANTTAHTGQVFWSWPDDGTHASSIADTGTLWSQSVLPVGTVEVMGLAQHEDQLAAVTLAGFVVSVDGGLSWTAGSRDPGAAGDGFDIVHDGTSFVAVTGDGDVLATADVTTLFAKVSDLGAATWKLATDGAGTIVAYQWMDGATQDFQVSTDQGATWTAATPPATMMNLVRVRYGDGRWLAASGDPPYLWESSDPTLASWTAAPLPLDETSSTWALYEVVYGDGQWVASGNGWTVTSGREQAPQSGAWLPSAEPMATADAGFLRGEPIDTATPSAGDVLLYDGSKWTPCELYAEGLDEDRPAAAADLTGLEYRATDTGTTYVCRGSAGWLVRSAGDGPDRATGGTFGAADYLSAVSPVAAPELAAGQSFVAMLWPTAVPAGGEVLAAHGDAGGARGWELRVGDNAGDRGELSLWLSGLNGGVPIQLTGATWNPGVGSMHVLALTIVAATGDLHYSWDGQATATIAAPAGAYVPPNAADPLYLGRGVIAAAPAADCELCALRTFSTELVDASLEAAGSLAARALGRIPVLSGTVTVDVAVARLSGQDGYVLPTRWKTAGSLALAMQTNGTLLKTAR